MSALEIKNLNVSFRKKQVIKNLSLSIEKGKLCVILGLNGSGKTTLLNAICGFIKSEGNIVYNGKEIINLNEKDRFKILSFIQQTSSLKDGFSVLEVALMGLNVSLNPLRMPNKLQIDCAVKVLEETGLKDFIYRDFYTLSQGEKQLVILSRCIIQNSPIMLMDEPDSALDFNNRHKTLSKIKEIIKEKDYACLMAMHDPNFALKYADTVFILDKGKITYSFTPKDTNEKTIQKILSSIYKDISLTKFSGGYLVGKNE